MNFIHAVITVAYCFFINFKILKTTDGRPDEIAKSVEENEDNTPDEDVIRDGHSFVALLDVVFQDGAKRSCSGAIIHDNVVVTAAHCFVHDLDETIQPEITASFIVIGTKKMFSSGYEQYLPIERILTHPKYDGWSADICLVYTFAGMTSDKPAKIIKLAGEKTVNQADYNITILTWRHPKEEETVEEIRTVKTTTDKCDGSSSQEDKAEKAGTQAPKWYARGHITSGIASTKNGKKSVTGNLFYKYPILQQKQDHSLQWKAAGDSKKMSRYLTSTEESEQQDDGIAVILMSPDTDSATNKPELRNLTLVPLAFTVNNEPKSQQQRYPSRPQRKQPQSTARRRQQGFRGWRRILYTLDNQLEAERYALVSSTACKKIIESSLAPRFTFNNGEVACYTSDEHFLTDVSNKIFVRRTIGKIKRFLLGSTIVVDVVVSSEDSGAPAVRRSRLVAVTIGSAESDGEHVGIGLKISCYCAWIADNIPGGNSISCCKNCCDVKHTEHYVHTTTKKRRKIKYLLK